MKFDPKKNKIREAILDAQNVGICSHLNPDCDNLGSLLAMMRLMEKLGKKVYPLQFDKIPEKYRFLPLIDSFVNEIDEKLDLLITVDCADIKRLGPIEEIMEQAKTVLNIDHHRTNENYGDINYVLPDKSSTCEIVYEIIRDLDYPMDEDMATLLFTGLITDTNRFLYESADENTLACGASLVKNGADKQMVMEQIYQSNSLAGRKLAFEILSKTRFYDNNKIAISHIMKKDVEENDLEMADIDDLVNEFRDTKEVEVSVLLKEKEEDLFKISFRSTRVDVCEIAKAFGGGGHIYAAGCEIPGDRKSVEEKIITEMKDHEI